MKHETMLDIAKADMRAATALLQLYNLDDEAMINRSAYFIQQAIEKALKHVLEVEGVGFRNGHDIEDYLNLLGRGVLTEQLFEELLFNSASITKIEAKTRYVKNYRASLEIVLKAQRLFEQLVAEIELMQPVSSPESVKKMNLLGSDN